MKVLDIYMPDQIAVYEVLVSGNEEDGWDLYWLTQAGEVDPMRSNEEYKRYLPEKYSWLNNISWAIIWDDFNKFGMVINTLNSKPLLELVGETVG